MRPLRIVVAASLILAFAGIPAPAQERTKGRGRQLRDDVAVTRDIVFGKGGENDLALDLYLPKTLLADPMPGVVYIHGGGWSAGDKADMQHLGNCSGLAARGYAVASINYRLSGEAAFPAALEDCKCAVRWLRANAARYHVDPDRLGVWGTSAGGHLALLTACTDESAGLEGKGGNEGVSSRVQAVCSWYGPSDFTLPLDAAEQKTVRMPIRFLGGTQKENPENYRLASPAAHVTKDDPPTLLVHGEQDPVVPIRQSEWMKEKLTAVGVEVRLIRVKNASHGFKPVGGEVSPSMTELSEATYAFFDAHLGKKAAAIGEGKGGGPAESEK